MRLRKIQWKNDSILGNLEIDITKDTSTSIESYDTIVLAGDNGSGKTTVLNKLSRFLNLEKFDFEAIEYFSDSGKIFTATKSTIDTSGYHKIVDLSGKSQEIRTNKHNNSNLVESNVDDIRRNGCIFSKARSDFKTQKIQQVTAKTTDTEKYLLDGEEDFTSLKQLLIDIENQDNEEYRRINRNRTLAMTENEFYNSHSKIARFKNAINSFFDHIQFDSVKTINDGKEILFIKNGNEIPIDGLSTGEKQIVFRGIYLLRNLNKIRGGTVMIDEPELSMHPRWQNKILEYYKRLFTIDGSQVVQLFFATHSELVLANALKDDNTLVVILESSSGNITAQRITAPYILPIITSAELNYMAFNIYSIDYHIQLFNYVQVKHRLRTNSVKAIDSQIKRHRAYDNTRHQKISTYGTTYFTVSTFIRNEIHHATRRTYSDEELKTSIELLIDVCR